MVASSGGARTAPRFLRLPEAAAENAGKTAVKEINAFCFDSKNVLNGDDGWGEFVAAADPAAICGNGARQIEPPHPLIPS